MSKKIFTYTSNLKETQASVRAGLITFFLFVGLSVISLIIWGVGGAFWVFSVIAIYFFVVLVLEYVNMISIKRNIRKVKKVNFK